MAFKCYFDGLILPLFGASEMDWPNVIRLILYLMGLGWTFLGVAVISDVFMAGIEKVTSSKKRVKDKTTGRTITVYVWNDTVANLTLMALGSSAPEILLSVIEITTSNFQLGPLGAGTIVGSAAFNLLCISAVCVLAIPDNDVRYIQMVPVYVVTSSCSVFAYLWLMFILMVTSPDVCEIWEATLTLMFCPLLVVAAYIADRGYCSRSSGDEEKVSRQTIPEDVGEEELASIEQQIRDQHGSDLTQEQVVKFMKAQFFSKRSRAFYRHAAMEAQLHGRESLSKERSPAPGDVESLRNAGETSDAIAQEKSKSTVEIGFAVDGYSFMESCGFAKVVLVRSGPITCKATVKYITREGTAKQVSDYEHMEGTITFEKGETQQTLSIAIKDDVAFEEDEEFYIDLSEPAVECDCGGTCTAQLSDVPMTTVVIIDDDLPGDLRFKATEFSKTGEELEVVEDTKDVVLECIVERFNGCNGSISCHYKCDNMDAVDGVDYEGSHGHLHFEPNVMNQVISVTIKPRGRLKKAAFNLVLHDPKGCKFDSDTDGGDEKSICHVTIKGKTGETRQNLFKEMKSRVVSANAIMGGKNWGQQFKDALFAVGEEDDDDEEPSGGPGAFDYFMHVLAIPWKLLFAFVPPTDYCGGWACFVMALVMIAVVTAVVGDMANLVGCCFDILPETAAITFVALGTSLPDTFASKTAAEMDPYADASIGNITGSNSINVFMGIGLSWILGAFRWETGEPDEIFWKGFSHLTQSQKDNVQISMDGKNGHAVFITPAGTIWFNLMVFSVNAFFAIQHLLQRRRKWGGELGGPKKGFMGQYFSGFFLVLQWFIYIIASIIFARMGDSALSYGQIAERAITDELPLNMSTLHLGH